LPTVWLFPRARSYKKEDEPLLNLRGYKPLLKREGTYVCTKEGIRVPSLNTGGFDVYSMNKTWGRKKMFITGANEAS
jgi:hypothetical protein